MVYRKSRKFPKRTKRRSAYGPFGRRRVKKRNLVKKNNGFIQLVRKFPEIAISNSGLVGNINVVDPTSMLNVGVPVASVGSSQGYDIPFSCMFRLDKLINYLELTNIVDKYKILGAYIRLYYNKSGSAAGATAGMPYVEHCTDHDDNQVPTLAYLREKMGITLKTFKNASSYIGMMCRPKPVREVFANGLSTAYEQPMGSIWIDSSYPNVEHYGIKGVIRNVYLPNGNAGTEVFKIDIALKVIGKDIQ